MPAPRHVTWANLNYCTPAAWCALVFRVADADDENLLEAQWCSLPGLLHFIDLWKGTRDTFNCTELATTTSVANCYYYYYNNCCCYYYDYYY